MICTPESRINIALKVFMATMATAGVRAECAPQPEPTGKPATVTVERFVSGKWIRHTYAWDGTSYSIDVSDQYRQDGSRIW